MPLGIRHDSGLGLPFPLGSFTRLMLGSISLVRLLAVIIVHLTTRLVLCFLSFPLPGPFLSSLRSLHYYNFLLLGAKCMRCNTSRVRRYATWLTHPWFFAWFLSFAFNCCFVYAHLGAGTFSSIRADVINGTHSIHWSRWKSGDGERHIDLLARAILVSLGKRQRLPFSHIT